MRIEAPTLTGIVERMERDGWIQRTPCARDRRKKLLKPTEQVLPIWERVVEAGQTVRTQAERGIEPSAMQDVLRLLEQIQKNVSPPNGRSRHRNHAEPSG